MKAIVYRQTGPAEVLELVERDAPGAPGPGEVTVRIAVSGVNPTDWKSRATAPGRALDVPQVPIRTARASSRRSATGSTGWPPGSACGSGTLPGSGATGRRRSW